MQLGPLDLTTRARVGLWRERRDRMGHGVTGTPPGGGLAALFAMPITVSLFSSGKPNLQGEQRSHTYHGSSARASQPWPEC